MKQSVLYLSYDGMLEPLGESQVLGYLERLAGDYKICLVSFEKAHDRSDLERMETMRKRLSQKGITWRPLPYHKSPSALATAYDIAVGAIGALALARRERVAIVHARSYVPALMALAVKRLSGARFLFDMRGFWADERVDGGLWPREGLLYRTTKALERRFLLAADHVVTLTHASARVIEGFEFLRAKAPPVSVIPTCADLDKFCVRSDTRGEPFVFGYVGSIGTWYLFDDTLRFFHALMDRRPDARLLVVNRHDHEAIRGAARRAGIPAERLELVAADHSEVAAHISRMHAAAALIKPAYSKIASAPTKLAEYLGCGVPCIGNAGVGDMEHILTGQGVGVTLSGFSDAAIAQGVDQLLSLLDDPAIRSRCAAVARELFALDHGVQAYQKIYEALGGKGSSPDVSLPSTSIHTHATSR